MDERKSGTRSTQQTLRELSQAKSSTKDHLTHSALPASQNNKPEAAVKAKGMADKYQEEGRLQEA